MARLVLSLWAATIGCCFGANLTAPISVETPYNHITIERFGSIIEMRSLWRTTSYRESAIDTAELSNLVVPYTRLVAASAIFHPAPKSVLMIGLGGGGINQFFAKAFPTTALETVELDPTVFKLAEQYMAFKTSEKNKVTLQDGRMFLRRSKATYDWIILDAFRGGFVPPHLKTAEFYRLVKSHLTPNGIFIANVHTGSALFQSDLRTILAVFPQVGWFDVPPKNAVIVGTNFASPLLAQMLNQTQPAQFNDTFKRNVDLASLPNVFHLAEINTNQRAPLLTDDFAPTEFLDAVRNNNRQK